MAAAWYVVYLHVWERLLIYASLPPLAPLCCSLVPQVSSDDPLLVNWVKDPAPFIGLPPPNMNLTGWRDPFVVERPCETNDWEWIVLMGSGEGCGGGGGGGEGGGVEGVRRAQACVCVSRQACQYICATRRPHKHTQSNTPSLHALSACSLCESKQARIPNSDRSKEMNGCASFTS